MKASSEKSARTLKRVEGGHVRKRKIVQGSKGKKQPDISQQHEGNPDVQCRGPFR